METVTVYFGSSDLDRINIQLVIMTVGMLFLGVLAVRALEGIRDALVGKDLAELKAEVARVKAEADETEEEDLRAAWLAGKAYAEDDEAPDFGGFLSGHRADHD